MVPRRAGCPQVRTYHVTDGEINELSTLGGTTTSLLSAATFALGVALNIRIALMTGSVTTSSGQTLFGAEIVCWIIGAVSIIVAIVLLIRRVNRAEEIKNLTKFPDDAQ